MESFFRSQKYQVSAVPTFAFVQDGQLVGQIRGADAAGLERMIAQFATMK